MKKYQQLFLAIISIFSLACLLIYRHEYNKLRYVLEVLNFFGTPGLPSANLSACADIDSFNKFSRGPLPAWQRISNSLFVYSAFWDKFDDEERVKAFAVGTLTGNLMYKCRIWYDTNPKIQIGQFDFSELIFKTQDAVHNKVASSRKAKAFEFYCKSKSKDTQRIPIGVTFFQHELNQFDQVFIPVVNLKSSAPPQNSTGVCVMPGQFPQYSKSDYLEFLSFHKVIGINYFIIYGGIDHYNLLSSVQIDKSNKIKIVILPWNYPYFEGKELMKIIAENDCKTRATGLLENVVMLDWNKFLVPRYFLTISTVINELASRKKINKFLFSTLLFCTEYKDNFGSNSSMPIIFRKSRYNLLKNDIQVPLYRPYIRPDNVYIIGKDNVAVHQYSNCQNYKFSSDDKKNELIDTSMHIFENEFFKSQILIM